MAWFLLHQHPAEAQLPFPGGKVERSVANTGAAACPAWPGLLSAQEILGHLVSAPPRGVVEGGEADQVPGTEGGPGLGEELHQGEVAPHDGHLQGGHLTKPSQVNISLAEVLQQDLGLGGNIQ